MPTLDAIRTAGERDIEKVLKSLDNKHKAMLRQAIRDYGSVDKIPDFIWQQVQWNYEEQLAAAILLLLIAADDDTTTRIADDGGGRRQLTSEELGAYLLLASSQANETASSTTNTLRDRLNRKMQDQALTGPGAVGKTTTTGVDTALNDVFTKARRETISIDTTTQGISGGQRGAAERARGGGEGANTTASGGTTIDLIWRTEKDNLVCPRCSPLEGTTEDVWGLVFPNGPGPEAHPNCRCSLEVKVVPASTE